MNSCPSLVYLTVSRSFIDKFVVGSSDLIALLLLLFMWLLWLLLLLWLVPLTSLLIWWCTAPFSEPLWTTDVVIDVMFKSVMRSTDFNDSYVTAGQNCVETYISYIKFCNWENYWRIRHAHEFGSIICCIRYLCAQCHNTCGWI